MKKKEILARFFLIAATILAVLISVSGTLSISSSQDLIFQVMFLPVALFFVFEFIQVFFISKRNLSETLIEGKKGLLIGIFVIILFAYLTKTLNIINKKKEKDPTPQVQTEMSLPQKTEENKPKEENTKFITITTKNPQTLVNVRKDPTTNSEIIQKVKRDETYPLIATEKDWYQIKLDENNYGWVFKDYVKLEK